MERKMNSAEVQKYTTEKHHMMFYMVYDKLSTEIYY